MLLNDVHVKGVTALEKPPEAGVSEAGKEKTQFPNSGLQRQRCVGQRRKT